MQIIFFQDSQEVRVTKEKDITFQNITVYSSTHE